MKNHEWRPYFPKDEMTGPQKVLTCEEEGFLKRLRDFAWVNGPIPDEEKYLERLAQSFLLSRYKFRKLWKGNLEKFFQKIDGCLVYWEDEQHRQKQVEEIAKHKHLGQIGALKRWKNHAVVKVFPGGEAIAPLSETDGIPEKQIHTNSVVDNTTKGAAPPVCDVPPAGGMGTQTTETQAVSSSLAHDAELIRRRAVELGLPIPSKKFARRLREKFLGVPITDVIPLLVRWDEQRSVGLWQGMSAEDFKAEAQRQLSPTRDTPRKPSQRELVDRELMERAEARDRARAAGAGGRA